MFLVLSTANLARIFAFLAYNPSVKYTPGPLVGEASGKAGCLVASHNRFGAYFRTRVIPVNAKTTTQQNARNSLASVAKAWKLETSDQKAAWASAALSVVLYDRLGRAYTPTGFQFFCSCNRNTYTYDPTSAIVTAPPSVAAPAALLSLTITCTSV